MVGQEYQPKTRLFEPMVGVVSKMGKHKKRPQVGGFWRPSFLFEGLRLSKNDDL